MSLAVVQADLDRRRLPLSYLDPFPDVLADPIPEQGRSVREENSTLRYQELLPRKQ